MPAKSKPAKQPEHAHAEGGAAAGSNIAAAVNAVLQSPPPKAPAAKSPASAPQLGRANANTDGKHGGSILAGLHDAVGGGVDDDEGDAKAPHGGGKDSDSDEDDDDGKRERGNFSLVKTKLAEYVIGFIRRTGQTFTAYTEAHTFHRPRNRMEALRFAQCMYAYLNAVPPLPADSEVLELLCRAFLAVHEADRCRNWTMADALALYPTNGSMLPRHLELQLMVDANNLDRANKAAYKVSPAVGKVLAAPKGPRRMFEGRGYAGDFAGSSAQSVRPESARPWNMRRSVGKPQPKAGGAGAQA